METAAGILVAAMPALLALLPVPWWLARARGRAAGILLDDRAALTVAPRIDTVLLDRWGTVTTGQLRVVAVDPVDPDHDRSLRWFAGALGHAFDDPVGRAIARLSSRGKVSQVQQHEGGGISGSVDRHPVRLGRPDWLGMELREEAGVTVGVQVDARPIGYITVADDVRPHAAEAVARLRAAGVEPVLVSEDDERNTRVLAEDCGIAAWHAETSYDARELVVADLRSRGRIVASAGAAPGAAADLALSDADLGRGIRLTDLDVARVAAALELARSAAARTTRSRRAGVILGVLGAGLALVGVLPLLAAVGYLLVAGAVVTVLAARG